MKVNRGGHLNQVQDTVTWYGRRMRPVALVLHRFAALSALVFSAATAVDYYGASPRFCQAGAGCEVVHAWSTSLRLDLVLPALGLICYSAIFALSLAPKVSLRRFGALGAQLGGLGALGFLTFQGAYLGAWCHLCVGVDTSAIIAGVAALPFVKTPLMHEPLAKDHRVRSWRSGWWPAWAVAIGVPLAWGFTKPPSLIPDGVRARYVDGAINVVLLTEPECAFCRKMHPALAETLAEARQGGATVHVDRVFVPLPSHRLARGAVHAILCAPDAKREAMTTLVYEGALVRDALIGYARQLDLDDARFVACLDDPRTDARVQDNLAFANSVGMRGLPTTYIGEHTLLGFDATAGAEPFRAALVAARTERPSRRAWWPFVLIALVALVLAALTRPRGHATKP